MNRFKLTSCYGILSIISMFILLQSCGLMDSLRIQKAIENESILSTDFHQVFSFKEVKGAIIIEAEIDGMIGNYILDSGASTVVDRGLYIDINPERMGYSKSIDSNGKKAKIRNVRTNEIAIEGVVFQDVVAYVMDMDKFSDVAGMPISGIIGANVMKECTWQIDYKAHAITITDDLSRLDMPNDLPTVDFFYQGKGVPTFEAYLGNKYCGEAIFDTGSNGDINLDYQYLDPNLSYDLKSTMVIGTNSTEESTMKIAKVPSFKFNGSFEVQNTVVSFEKDRPFGIIGNEFLKNYVVTFDWMTQRIYLDKYEEVPLMK